MHDAVRRLFTEPMPDISQQRQMPFDVETLHNVLETQRTVDPTIWRLNQPHSDRLARKQLRSLVAVFPWPFTTLGDAARDVRWLVSNPRADVDLVADVLAGAANETSAPILRDIGRRLRRGYSIHAVAGDLGVTTSVVSDVAHTLGVKEARNRALDERIRAALLDTGLDASRRRIAETTGLPENTVRSRLPRLRTEMADDLAGGHQ